jgi:hypothetical protein
MLLAYNALMFVVVGTTQSVDVQLRSASVGFQCRVVLGLLLLRHVLLPGCVLQALPLTTPTASASSMRQQLQQELRGRLGQGHATSSHQRCGAV